MNKILAAAGIALLLCPLSVIAAENKPIVLQVYSTDRGDGQDPQVRKNAELLYKTNRTSERKLLRVTDEWDFLRKLRKMQEEGVQIRRLIIQAHGNVGLTPVISFSSLPRSTGLDAMFVPGAEIMFESCSVAQGENGIVFMQDVGKTFLARNGGTVTGPVWYYIFIRNEARPFVGPLALKQNGASPLGQIEVEVARGGALTTSYVSPGVVELRQRMKEDLEQAGYVLGELDKAEQKGVRGAVKTLADVAELQRKALLLSVGIPNSKLGSLNPGVTKTAQELAAGFLLAHQKIRRAVYEHGKNMADNAFEAEKQARQTIQRGAQETVRVGRQLERHARPAVEKALPFLCPGPYLLKKLFDGR